MNKRFLFNKALTTAASICLLSYSAIGFAQDVDNRTNITAGIANYIFDNDKSQDDEIGLQIGLETPLFDSERWTGTLQYLDLDSDVIGSTAEANVQQYHLGANYNFDKISGFQPYLGAGLGKLRINRSVLNKVSGPSFDVNAGVKYFFSNNWMGKFEAMIVDTKDFDRDYIIGLSVGYVFGTPARSPAAMPAPTPEAPAPMDSDGDGVFDNADACPSTPRGNRVDARGCELDNDLDGVVDARDACPDTRMGLVVDSRGCVELDEEQRRQTLAVLFDTNMSDIKNEYQDEIEAFADFMEEYNNTRATIEGHTDSDGAEDYNQALSERRANAIRTELIMRYGISASRLTAVGFGESRPTATNSTAAGKAQNRRIEAEVSVMVETERMR